MGKFGKDAAAAIAELRKATTGNDPHLRIDAAMAMWRIDGRHDYPLSVLARELRASARRNRNQILHGLREFGPLAKMALPEIRKLLPAGPTVWSARDYVEGYGPILDSLLQIDPDTGGEITVPIFCAMLDDNDPYLRPFIIRKLGEIGPAASMAIPRLTKLFDTESVREIGYRPFYLEAAAGVALCRIDHQAPAVVPKFIDRLKHPEEQVKMIYVQALGDIGTNAQQAIPELAAFIRDERYVNRKGFNLDLQDAAQHALTKIEGKIMRAK